MKEMYIPFIRLICQERSLFSLPQGVHKTIYWVQEESIFGTINK